jgi:hypothetical protein
MHPIFLAPYVALKKLVQSPQSLSKSVACGAFLVFRIRSTRSYRRIVPLLLKKGRTASAFDKAVSCAFAWCPFRPIFGTPLRFASKKVATREAI